MSRLPIHDALPEVTRHLRETRRVVVSAPTGSGKTTALPLALLDEPWAATGRILLLEPRRVAARAAARHMASLLGEKLGATVGLTTGDGSTVSKATRLEVITDGVLPRRLLGDAELTGVTCVLFDEFHERSVSADLGLAMVLDVAELRSDPPRIGILSATLDTHHIARAIGAAVVTSEGRTHPVEVEYRPSPPGTSIAAAVARAVLTEIGRADGDVLAFVPGMGEIRRVTSALEGRVEAVVLPLHGSLGADAQDRALAPDPQGRRKVIVATDVAETSLTIDGVTTVIDSGQRRASLYSPRTGMDRLETVRISRASADQRAGRAGRTRPGRVVRLWAGDERRAEADPPQITTSDPAPVLLAAAAWSGSLDEMRLLDAPPPATVSAATTLLTDLGLFDADGRLTALGRRAAALPTHPRLATMLLGADTPSERSTGVAIAALLSERDVFTGGRLPVDLALRIDTLDGDAPPPGVQVDRGRLRRVRDERRRLARLFRTDATAGDTDATGALLARAFPDRIAARRGSIGTFVTTGGRGVRIPDTDPLATEAFVVAVDLDDRGRDATAWLAAALDADVVAAMPTTTHRLVRRVPGGVDVTVEQRLGAIVLSSAPADPTPEERRRAILDGIVADGIESLGPDRAFRSLQARLTVLHTHLGNPWPAVDDATLAASAHEWLDPFVTGRRRNIPLLEALRSHVGWPLMGDVERLAPTHVTIPSGRSARLDYDDAGGPPVLAVKLQEMFGARSSPTIADGRVPVVVHLLSPAGRPVQVTSDLAGFWERGYHDVRKELRGRYPRHPWPEDPLDAAPTRRTKPR